MKLTKLTRKLMLEKAGINPSKAPIAGGGVDKWTPVMILSGAQSVDKSHLVKSIAENVDDPKKRSFYLQMVDALFRAVTLDDFSQFFNGSVVIYKVAHSFKYKGKTESLYELKKGKKDRIYVYPYNGKCGRFIFVLEALHKDQQNTPPEIKAYAEHTIKSILDTKLMAPVN
ncbi:hypothetical protein ACIGFL_03565 [Pseudomonas sp. NPDC077649]|uniref:hypothetical protein n=1 Tax=Pseudomonas sp. NPDC077649 TaxID=3364423 RepID=UPI0037CA8773